MLSELMNKLININKKTCDLIWNLPDVVSRPAMDYPKLIIPHRRDRDQRISEQEARFVYCSVLNNSDFFYSIETPTERRYGEGKRSATSMLFNSKRVLRDFADYNLHTVNFWNLKAP
ncbi:hypothetical protein Asulf_01618 [Archaeoglobus sulfaticallidus PM70-1]|uniref:Uncharacterized protein n=2 Tax=Archaeoglobus TaxID=2233 RepID=N0BDA2_9EURY|nr:hypothetical protein Asulf_01618 [Archaeoglobus sulfaticallidus PM70-1]